LEFFKIPFFKFRKIPILLLPQRENSNKQGKLFFGEFQENPTTTLLVESTKGISGFGAKKKLNSGCWASVGKNRFPKTGILRKFVVWGKRGGEFDFRGGGVLTDFFLMGKKGGGTICKAFRMQNFLKSSLASLIFWGEKMDGEKKMGGWHFPTFWN